MLWEWGAFKKTLMCDDSLSVEFCYAWIIAKSVSLQVYVFPLQRGFVTGGADKCVKFWEFELVKDETSVQKR